MGLENIEQADEISEYASLPFALRDRLPSYQIDNALALAFDAELDGIRQKSDRDMMDTWLSEVEDLAQEVSITIFTDALRNQIDEMPEPSAADHSSVQRVSESISDDDSDAGLAQLFASLTSPETL